MTKNEYLKALASSLNGHISREEVSDILRDYREFFDDGALQQEEEWQTAQRLGDPKEVAAQIVAEAYIGQAQKKPTMKNLFKAQGAVKIYSTAAFVASIPLMLAMTGLSLGMLLIFLLLTLSAILLFTGILMAASALPSSALWLAGITAAGALFAALTILLLVIMMLRRFVKWTGGLFAKVITKKKAAPPSAQEDASQYDEMEIPPIIPVQPSQQTGSPAPESTQPDPSLPDSQEVSEP